MHREWLNRLAPLRCESAGLIQNFSCWMTWPELRKQVGTQGTDYPEHPGSFDVTCAQEIASELASIAASASELLITKAEAKAYFDRRDGG